MKTNRQTYRSARGAAFMEFSVGMVIFATVVAAIFEVGISFYRKNRVESAAIAATQDVRMHYTRKEVPDLCQSIISGGIDGSPCEKLEECAVEMVHKRIQGVVPLRHRDGSDDDGVSLTASLTPVGTSARLSLQGQMTPSCLICGVFPTLHFTIGQEVTIQNRIQCTS